MGPRAPGARATRAAGKGPHREQHRAGAGRVAELRPLLRPPQPARERSGARLRVPAPPETAAAHAAADRPERGAGPVGGSEGPCGGARPGAPRDDVLLRAPALGADRAPPRRPGPRRPAAARAWQGPEGAGDAD